ncbi:hypothetical protein N7455_002982 [Penicillium solitum]|uniref:uncharacterized protein n=1 Tax=Penicillium solitum TaxID=60172 RepID=UPI0032C3F1DD|nr:hypothetical protein N7455_002982 [Penicillium solitum]
MPFAVTGRHAPLVQHLATKSPNALDLGRESMRVIVAQSANAPVTKATLVLSVIFKILNARISRRSKDIHNRLWAHKILTVTVVGTISLAPPKRSKNQLSKANS